MWRTLSRFLVAVWFIGMVVMTVRGTPVAGQDPTEAAKFLPLMSRYAPLTSDPLLRNYVGLMVANGDTDDPDFEIYTIRGDGSEPHRLTDNAVDETEVVWSADGAKIAFVQPTLDRPTQSQAMLMNTDGSNQQPLLQGVSGDSISLKWAPTKQQLLVLIRNEFPNFRSRLMVVMPNGSVRTIVDSTTDAIERRK